MATNPALKNLLDERLRAVTARVHSACRRANRDPASVHLVAVTKSVSLEVAQCLVELGVKDLAESRPQELWRKASATTADVRWHQIGHLQRNKIERTLQFRPLIHSVDSQRLLETIEREAARISAVVDVLLEVNASREPNKHGFAPEDITGVASGLSALQYVRVRGLMTMAAYADDPQESRPTFRLVRELAHQLSGSLHAPHSCAELSMGMTNDYEVAIEEGATLIRVGTALFDGLDASQMP